MRGQIEKECLFKVKEFFFCYKERNLEMMLSNLCYVLKDEDLLDNINLYIQSRRNSFCGMKFEDIKEVFLAIRDSKENPQLSEFPDFIFENGFIEHFEITSSNEGKKGAEKKIDEFLFNKRIAPQQKEFDDECKNMLVGETKSKSWERQDVKHSYENLESSLKNNLEKHIKSFDNYSGRKDLKIYLIDYDDFGIEMCEDIESNPKYFAKNRKEPQYFNNYRLSKDKKILDYLYQHKDKIDYVIMNYYDFCEVIKISNIPNIIESLPYDYVFVGKENTIIQKHIFTRIGFNLK